MNLVSSAAYALSKNEGARSPFGRLDRDIETDILIVGGGITGALVANRLLDDGCDVTLVDRRKIGHGSTSATTSMLQYEIDVPLHELIPRIGEAGAVGAYWGCYQAIDRLGATCEAIGAACGFERKASLYFADRPTDRERLEREYACRLAYGFPVSWLEPDTITEKFGLGRTYGGILSAQGASVDAFRLAHDLHADNHRRGARIFDETHLTAFDHRADGVSVASVDGYCIRARRLVFCNGFEATEIIREPFVRLTSTFVVMSERQTATPPWLNETLFWNARDPYMYMRATDDGRFLVGGGDETWVDAATRDALLPQKTALLEDYLTAALPDHGFRTEHSWAGIFGETKDGLPYVGAHPDFASTDFVLGFGGNGITFSVMGAEVLAASLRGETHAMAEYFRFGR